MRFSVILVWYRLVTFVELKDDVCCRLLKGRRVGVLTRVPSCPQLMQPCSHLLLPRRGIDADSNESAKHIKELQTYIDVWRPSPTKPLTLV